MFPLNRILGRTRIAEPEPPSVTDHLAKIAKGRMLDSYKAGLRDGILECLAQLEGRSKYAQGYAPELTDELRDWIAAVRARVDQEEAASER